MVDEVAFADGRVVGIEGRSGGKRVREHARFVIGADGRNSGVAKRVEAPAYDAVPTLSIWYFSYWSAFPARRSSFTSVGDGSSSRSRPTTSPAEHWRHLRTTNPIESSFATVRLRTRVTKGAGSKAAALAMAYKLLESAQERWRRFNGHELVADVLAGVKFKDGMRVTDDDKRG